MTIFRYSYRPSGRLRIKNLTGFDSLARAAANLHSFLPAPYVVRPNADVLYIPIASRCFKSGVFAHIVQGSHPYLEKYGNPVGRSLLPDRPTLSLVSQLNEITEVIRLEALSCLTRRFPQNLPECSVHHKVKRPVKSWK